MSTLHVLVYGLFTNGACNVYRFGILERALAAHGVELRSFSGGRLAVPVRDARTPERMYASQELTLDRSELDWADVIVFRRFYSTTWTCIDCAFVSHDPKRARRHRMDVRHMVLEPDRLVRPLYSALEAYPELLRGRAMVYETDDDLLNIQPWNGMRNRTQPEEDLIKRMLGRADLVTVSTPALRARLQGYNGEIRVLRNAVDPSWYTPPPESAPAVGSPRLLYYGSPARFRDYEVCQPAVDEVVRATPGARRVWLGALNARAGGGAARVLAAVDEAGPFIDDPRLFAGELTAARPDIGLAPLVGDSFDQAKSELHWLEYSMAGAATVATRIAGGGPYDPIRDGVDGLLVGTHDEWLHALRQLAASPAMREDLASAARERVVAEYTVDVRAAEWADAYRWAAEHAGRGVAGRVHGLGPLAAPEVQREGRASLAARAQRRDALAAAPGALAAVRAGRPSCGSGIGEAPSLVTVVLPIVDEVPAAVERALRSVLTGSHQALDVLLIADAAWPHDLDALVQAVAPGDGRVRTLPREVPGSRGAAADAARAARLGGLVAGGVAAAKGDWIAPLAADAEFRPDHVAVLLGIAQQHELEFVYGQAQVALPEGEVVLGAWPPTADEVLTFATELFALPLARVVPLVPDAWRDAETTGWAFWRSLLETGARMAGISYVVTRLSPLDLGTPESRLPATPVPEPDDAGAQLVAARRREPAPVHGRRGAARGRREGARRAR